VIAVAPQCPRDDTFGGSWYGGESRTQRQVVSLVRELGKRRSVDPQRISLVGYSMGAIGLWDLIARHRELFAAAVPIAGDLNPESARGLVDFPIWAFHGEHDRLVRNDATRAVAALMKQLGGVFRYTELAGVGHDSWQGAFGNAELMPWLLAQHR
jgi:predicted peptidase